MPDELREIDITTPYDLERQIGYDPVQYDGRSVDYIGFWWLSELDDPMITDGYLSYTGDSRGFVMWDHNAGDKLVEKTGLEYGIESSNPPLTQLLTDHQLEIGNAENMENSAFLFDIVDRKLYIGDRDWIQHFCKEENESPDNISNLPDDPKAAAKEVRQNKI